MLIYITYIILLTYIQYVRIGDQSATVIESDFFSIFIFNNFIFSNFFFFNLVIHAELIQGNFTFFFLIY